MATVNPPFQSPDEDAHFTRVFQLSEGTLIAQKNQDQVGGWLPQSIFDAYQPFPNIKKVDLAIVHKLLREPFAKEPGISLSSNTQPSIRPWPMDQR